MSSILTLGNKCKKCIKIIKLANSKLTDQIVSLKTNMFGIQTTSLNRTYFLAFISNANDFARRTSAVPPLISTVVMVNNKDFESPKMDRNVGRPDKHMLNDVEIRAGRQTEID